MTMTVDSADSVSELLLRRRASQSSLRCSSVDVEYTLKFMQITKYCEKQRMVF